MKKTITSIFILVLIITNLNFSVAQNNLEFVTLERDGGTAFFAMDNLSGQVYYMLDYGNSDGMWKEYGKKIIAAGSTLLFQASTIKGGTAFFAMNKTTGQLYFMLDIGNNAGNWKSYGNVIPSKVKSQYSFSSFQRKDGTAFFSQDIKTGQAYYMLDYGPNEGKWKPYGKLIKH